MSADVAVPARAGARIAARRRPVPPLSLVGAEGFRRTRRDGEDGFALRIRLTSYRSLPLSCIRELTLTLDDADVDMATARFILHGQAHRLTDLAERIDLWWYVLDPAEVFVPWPTPLADGPHRIEALLTMIMPFATGGRTTLTTTAAATVVLGADDPARGTRT